MAHRILVIEDSKVIQRLVAVSLQSLDVDIESRYDGESGLAATIEAPPDLIVLDIGLPRLSGWDVLEHVRRNVATRHVKVLVLTAHAQEENRTRADHSGADKFMSKPFQPNMLRDAVSALLSLRPSVRDQVAAVGNNPQQLDRAPYSGSVTSKQGLPTG